MMSKNKRYSGTKSAFKCSLHKIRGWTAIFILYSLICVILGILLSLSQVSAAFFDMNSFLSTVYSLLQNIDIFGLALGLAVAIFMFSKYMNRISDNVIRSLPVSDKQFFIADFLCGLMSFVIPSAIGLVLQTVIGRMIEASAAADGVFTTIGLSYGLILNFIFGYCTAVFALSLSNGIAEGCVTFVILNFLPSVIYSFTAFFRSAVLGLAPVDEFANTIKMRTSYDILVNAIARTDDLQKVSYSQMMLICLCVILICAALFALSFFAFIKLRSAEMHNSKLKTAISVTAVSFLSFYCGFLVLFFRRTGVTLFNAFIVVPTMLLVSFTAFYIAHTVVDKTIHIRLRKFMPYVPVAVVLCAVGVFYFSGGFGSANFIPVVNDIESVEINYMDSGYQNAVMSKKYQMYDSYKTLTKYDLQINFPVKYTDKNSILAVVRYHNDLLNEYLGHDMVETSMQYSKLFKESADIDADCTRTVITYKLKDGGTIKRYYNYNGNEKTLENLGHIQPYEHSVKEIEPRYKDYLERKDDDNAVHTLNIIPINSDMDTNLYDITDRQLKLMTQAIAEDEKNASKDDLMKNSEGDVCILEILPHEDNEDEPYFEGVFKKSMDGYYVYVKPCYKNLIDFIKNEIQAGDALKGYSGKEIKQLFVSPYMSRGVRYSEDYYGSETSQYYKFSMKQSYSYDYNSCSRFYNMSALSSEDKAYVDGQKISSESIDFLFSKAHVSADTNYSGVLVVVQNWLEKPYETDKSSNGQYVSEQLHSASGKIVLYVSQNDYQKFLQMNGI